MAGQNHELNAKILLRYDTYSAWMGSDVILQPGEIAVATFPDLVSALNPPRAFGLKVGDGQRYFDELPWIQASSSDVYAWAKEPTKPTYTALEIEGLDAYINAHGGGGGSGGGSGSGSYQIIYDNNTQKYILQQYNEETGEWENTTSAIDFSGILNRLNAIERWANGALTQLGNIEAPLVGYIYEEVVTQLERLDVNDEPVENQFVTAVEENNGLITVTRAPLSMSNITEGVLSTTHGGTGLNEVAEDQVLIGSLEGNITTKTFVTEIENNRNAFATVGAIIDYVRSATAGLTGAMHFVGEATVFIAQTNSNVNPQIVGYDFTKAQPGDVILANNAQEFVWTGSTWRLLGDEGSYAIKGSITNADIATEAGIAPSKIDGLTDLLNGKVDKIDGKQLSTNDFTSEYKDKLDTIQEGAQANIIESISLNSVPIVPVNKNIDLQIPVLTQEQIASINVAQANTIENIFVNGSKLEPTTINEQPKSVEITFLPYTQDEKTKLQSIQTGAQVNSVETITINGTQYTPDATKNITIGIEQIVANINISNLQQNNDTYVLLDCGTSVEVM